MMSKTHLSVGIAASLAIAPATPEGLTYALMGGSVGSLICDVDRNAERPTKDHKQGWLISFTIFFAAFMHESYAYWRTFRVENLLSDPVKLICFGAFLLLLLFAINGAHRGFSHSLLMFLASSVLVYFISPQTSLFYGTGFLTHILLDLLNKRPVRIFYPAKGVCLNLFYVDGTANGVLMLLGMAAAAALLFLKFGVTLRDTQWFRGVM